MEKLKPMFSTRVEADLKRKVKVYCVKNGIKLEAFTEHALENHLNLLTHKGANNGKTI